MLCTYKSREKAVFIGTSILKDRFFEVRVPINHVKKLILIGTPAVKNKSLIKNVPINHVKKLILIGTPPPQPTATKNAPVNHAEA